jgi:hypothetical protein
MHKIFSVEHLTLNDLKEILSDRFHIEETDALMTARYIFEQDENESDNKVIFNEDKHLEAKVVVKRLQNFVRLNNTLAPYKLDEEEISHKINQEIHHEIVEDIPQESIEAIEEEQSKPVGSSKPVRNLKPAEIPKEHHEEEEIDDDYGDIENEFDNESDKRDQHKPASADTPEIKEESPKNEHPYESNNEEDDNESEISEQRGLEIAERCFSKMADLLKSKNTTVIEHFKDYISSQIAETEDGQEFEIIYIPPTGFIEGIDDLGLDLTEMETKCLLVIMVKPELDNIILVQDLCQVMENFGIHENIDGITDSEVGNSDRKPQQKKEGRYSE